MTAAPDADPAVRDLPPVHVWPIARVREADRNPRRIPEQAVKITAGSLRRFGWKQPLVVDADGTLVAGHTRVRAARTLGLTKVPVVIADDLTADEVNAYRIADNRTHDFTTWDLPELTQQLAELEADFADVLALADWEAVTAALVDSDSLIDADLPGEASASLKGGSFVLSVFFQSKEQALAAQEHIIDLPGVLDVRHKL